MQFLAAGPGLAVRRLGLGHDTDYWARFLAAITEIDPEMNVNIEHEDAEYGNVEGLQISARNLLEAAARL